MNSSGSSATALCGMAKQNGFIRTVHSVFGNCVSVSIPVSVSTVNTDISELSLSVRAYNGLKRSGIFTIGDLAQALQENTLYCIRNLGRKSVSEIKTKFLDYCYRNLSEQGKMEFFQSMLTKNSSVLDSDKF